MTDIQVETGRIFLWAAIGHQDEPPGRVEVIVCEHCAVLVSMERADRHIRWHRRQGA